MLERARLGDRSPRGGEGEGSGLSANAPHVREIELVTRIARDNFGLMPLAVASGGMKHVIEQVLNHLRIRQLFSAVVTSEDVQRQKPAPDISWKPRACIGVPPHSCRAYEDTDLGMGAIRAAGMEAIDVRQLLLRR
jgi:beta-phosphoglucomutase-like phosphatase (HAD superfamily)